MSDLSSTLANPLRVLYPNNVDKNEVRAGSYGFWEYFQMNSMLPMGIISPDLEKKAAEKWDTRFQIPVLKEGDIAINSGLAPLTIPVEESDSALLTLTAVDLWFGFTMAPAQYADGLNDVSYAGDWRHKFNQGIIKMAAALNTAGQAILETNKNQVWTDKLVYDTTGDVLSATNAQKDEIFADLAVVQAANDYTGNSTIIGNAGIRSIARGFMHNNDNNVQSIIDDNKFLWSYDITNAASTAGTGFHCIDGNLGVLYQMKPENKEKYETGNGRKWDILENVPIVNADLMEFYYDDAADISGLFSGLSNFTQSKVEAFIYSIRVYFVYSYNSAIATKANPFIKFDIATS